MKEHLIVEMDSEDTEEFRSLISGFDKYKVIENIPRIRSDFLRTDEELRTVEGMDWHEEQAELQNLYKNVMENQNVDYAASLSPFENMFRSWEPHIKRFGLDKFDNNILKERILSKLDVSNSIYQTFDKRPGRYTARGVFVYNTLAPNYSPREFRTGILYYGIDGKKHLNQKQIAKKEPVKVPTQIINSFTFRSLWNLKHELLRPAGTDSNQLS